MNRSKAGTISTVERHAVRHQIKQMAISTREIAERLGVSILYLRNVLCGSVRSRSLLNRVAKVLHLPKEPGFGFVEFTPPGKRQDGSAVIIPKETALRWEQDLKASGKAEASK